MRNPGKGAFGDRQLGGAAPYPVFATDAFTGEANHNLRDGHEFQDWPRVMHWKETSKVAARAPAWSALRADALRAYAWQTDALALDASADAGRARALTHARHHFNPDLRRAHSMAAHNGGGGVAGSSSAARNVLVAEEWPPHAAAAHAAVSGATAATAAAERRAAAAARAGTFSRTRATGGLGLTAAAPGSARAQSPPSPLAPSTAAPLSGVMGETSDIPRSSAVAKAKPRKRRPAVEPAPFADRF
jgi:hypothetical protein